MLVDIVVEVYIFVLKPSWRDILEIKVGQIAVLFFQWRVCAAALHGDIIAGHISPAHMDAWAVARVLATWWSRVCGSLWTGTRADPVNRLFNRPHAQAEFASEYGSYKNKGVTIAPAPQSNFLSWCAVYCCAVDFSKRLAKFHDFDTVPEETNRKCQRPEKEGGQSYRPSQSFACHLVFVSVRGHLYSREALDCQSRPNFRRCTPNSFKSHLTLGNNQPVRVITQGNQVWWIESSAVSRLTFTNLVLCCEFAVFSGWGSWEWDPMWLQQKFLTSTNQEWVFQARGSTLPTGRALIVVTISLCVVTFGSVGQLKGGGGGDGTTTNIYQDDYQPR